jgi:zinc D-Ala-D-Ala carboxypeptidase
MEIAVMGDLSAHFSRRELQCRCCGRLQLDSRLLDGLEALRALAGAPVVIHAGYRCPRHNQQVGGVPHSEHTQGMAADIGLPGISLQRMYELALEVPLFAQGGIGVYDGGFLHVDVRERSARWARVSGRYVGIRELVREPGLAAEVEGATPLGKTELTSGHVG